MSPELSAEEHARRLKVYHETTSDTKAARKLGNIGPTGFTRWRRSQKLPVRKKGKRNRFRERRACSTCGEPFIAYSEDQKKCIYCR